MKKALRSECFFVLWRGAIEGLRIFWHLLINGRDAGGGVPYDLFRHGRSGRPAMPIYCGPVGLSAIFMLTRTVLCATILVWEIGKKLRRK